MPHRIKVIYAASGPQEILIHGPIGKSWWSDDGISGKEFTDALNAIPAGQPVIVGVNSQGGAVGEGLAIYNAIARRAADVTVRIDGYALSIASFFPLAAGKVRSPKSSIWMIHEPWSYTEGNADEHRQAADMLDAHAEVLVAGYEKRTKKSREELRGFMRAETWLTGEDAVKWGLADEESDNPVDLQALNWAGEGEPFKNPPRHLVCRRVAAALRSTSTPAASSANPPNMDRKLIIALLTARGIKVADDATNEQLLGLLTGELDKTKSEKVVPLEEVQKLQATVKQLTEANERERTDRITRAIDGFVVEMKLTLPERDAALARALKDESYLKELGARPAMQFGEPPIAVVAEDVRNVATELKRHWGKVHSPSQARQIGIARAAVWQKERARVIGHVMNAQTIDSDLQRIAILQTSIRAFALRMMPLRAFSTVFNGVQVEGTGVVVVPYFPLATSASSDFDGTYSVTGGGNNSKKSINVTRAAGGKRKYQHLLWTSEEFRQQPYFDLVRGIEMKAEKLAADVFADVLSVVKNAAYGAGVTGGSAPIVSVPANAFFTEQVVDIKTACDKADWPDTGRSLLLDCEYDGNLLKDGDVKNASAFGSNDPIIEGRIRRIAGFDYYTNAHVPANGEGLKGMAVFPSAVLFAQAPVEPTPDVRDQLTQYEVVVDPAIGAEFEYRRWGSASADSSYQVIESNYGYAAGEAAALKRVTT